MEDCAEKCSRVNELEQQTAALDRLLTEVCNEFMESDEDGKFKNSRLADEVNKILGI